MGYRMGKAGSARTVMLAVCAIVGVGVVPTNASVTARHTDLTRPSRRAAPPRPDGYFHLRTPGQWSSLPGDARCARRVHRSSWEPRPENRVANHTIPSASAVASSFAIRPRSRLDETYRKRWDRWLLPRVDGNFSGTTDEIFQWAACKWGLPDNLIRAVAVDESTWFQYLHFPKNASYGGGGGSCYWKYGCGDAFSSPTTASTVYCNGIAT